MATDSATGASADPTPPLPLPLSEAPGAALALALVALFVARIVWGVGDDWGLSALALRRGAWWTLLAHMLVHGGILHIAMNGAALAGVGAALTPFLGRGGERWARFGALFLGSGLAGATLFLAFNPHGAVPMVGASGAIYGLLGVLLRARVGGGRQPLWSPRMGRAILGLVQQNVVLILILAVPAFLGGSAVGLAWEAHLGGLLFGLLAGPWFFARKLP
ncbi:MAG: rhomboid family intramembrane serine protease [Sphingomonadaceae bacterium]|nr:rhomboid family intramembrane serine protease [Sphingomonadaceae bacterium]